MTLTPVDLGQHETFSHADHSPPLKPHSGFSLMLHLLMHLI